MTSRYFADVKICLRVYFEDSGLDNLTDQAVEAVDCLVGIREQEGELEDNGIEVIGEPVKVNP
jgi:hypothetical protein